MIVFRLPALDVSGDDAEITLTDVKNECRRSVGRARREHGAGAAESLETIVARAGLAPDGDDFPIGCFKNSVQAARGALLDDGRHGSAHGCRDFGSEHPLGFFRGAFEPRFVRCSARKVYGPEAHRGTAHTVVNKNADEISKGYRAVR